jgi:four helix bundle protein
MTQKELQDRLKTYAISIVKFAESLPDTLGFRTVRNQIVRCAPLAAANYRAACRGKSTTDFKYKLEIVEEELDETLFWLEFTVGLDESKRNLVSPLWKEGNELLSIIVSSINSIKKKLKKE